MSKENVFKNSVCLYVGKPNTLIKGKKGYISEKRDISPLKNDDEVMIPIKFFAESIGAVLKGDEKELSIEYKNRKILLSGKEKFYSVKKLCDALGIYLFCDSTGLLIYSDEDLSLNWESDIKLLRSVTESFIYDDVKGEEIVDIIKKKNPQNAHPRLILTKEKISAMKNELDRGNPAFCKAFEKVKELADSYLNTFPHFYDITDGLRLLYVSRKIADRILTLALTYILTSDEKYAVRCRQELISAASFRDWHPFHYLDTAELCNAVSLGYDWLYNWLDKEDRALIKKAIVTKGIDTIIDDYDGKLLLQAELTLWERDQKNLLTRTWDWRGSGHVCNWLFVCCGGLSVGAMAVCDEVSDEDRIKCERVLEQSLIDIRPAISLFAPNGGYEEGIDYWGFANKYYTYHMASLESAAGCDFGYTDAPGLRQTNSYVYAVNGPVSVFSYHDCGVWNSQLEPYVLFWAKRFNAPATALPRVEKILSGEGNVHDLLYYDSSFSEVSDAQMQKDILFENIGLFTARSGWDKNATYVGFHADDAIKGPGHSHNDGGTFILQAMGEAFFKDIGSDDYNISEYRKVYRVRAEGHNTIVVNPKNNEADMVFASKSEFIRCETKEDSAYAIADLTDLYRNDVNSAYRGVKLDNNRKVVTVQDEIVMKEPSEFYWFAHTEADIKISEDGRKAYLTLNGKTLNAEIVGQEEAQFSQMKAEPLPTSPNPPGQHPRDQYRKLVIHMENVKEVVMTVVFYSEGMSNYQKTLTLLKDWKIKD